MRTPSGSMLRPTLLALVLALCLVGRATAEEASEAEADAAAEESGSLFPVLDYTGDLWSRPALTGDWGGARTKLQDNGITVELNTTSIWQGVVDGGRGSGGEFGGSTDLTINLDFQKLGLWPGAFMIIKGETRYGDTVNRDTGALLAADLDSLFPMPGRDETTLTDVIFMQFLSESFGLVLGKLDTLGGDANEFAHGRKNDKFLNLAFAFNPVTLRTTPYSALGAGFIYLPNKRTQFTFTALDSEGLPTESGFDTVFDNGTTLSAELRVAVAPRGLPGHHLIGATWSNKDYAALDQDLRLLLGGDSDRNLALGFLRNRLAGTGGSGRGVLRDLIWERLRDTGPETESDSWSVYYNFDQYLHVEADDPDQGWGIFGRIGFADEKTNPIPAFYSFGFGGQGIIPGRDRDTFGIGYYYSDVSDDLPGLITRGLRLDAGQGFEVFYNIEATPWLHITPDVQVINPSRERVDTAVVLGVRVKIDF